MAGFYKPYPKEFYALNNLLPEEFLKDQPYLIINSIDFTNRCFNYNAVHPEKKQFSDDIYNNVIGILKSKKNLVFDYIHHFFPESQCKQYVEAVTSLINGDSKRPSINAKAELHYQLADLYHCFPNNPGKYLDGILCKIETRLAAMGKSFRYAEIDVLSPGKCHADLPCAKMRFFGNVDKDRPLEIPLDDQGACSSEVVAGQESLSIRCECPHKTATTHETPRIDKKPLGKEEQDPAAFFFSYLYPLFSDPLFDGSKMRKDITEFPFWSFIALPIYSANMVSGGPCGTILGHVFLSFSTEKKRADFLAHTGGAPPASWDTLTHLISRTLLDGRGHMVVEENYGSRDSLKDLLTNAGQVQDWERVIVLAASGTPTPKYCFKRFSGAQKGYVEYGRIWALCEKEQDCSVCNKAIHEPLISALNKGDLHNNHTLSAPPEATGEPEKRFFIQKLDDILEPRVLPSIGARDLGRYKKYILVFEFPVHTFYPRLHSPEQSMASLGEHYINKLIPIFDRTLMKRRVYRHSVKSAVAAIISRNHSHHIGSHVSPRADLVKILKRLDQLGHPGTGDQEKTMMAGILKSRLDQYIQKKADFLSEIVTEPITTTRTLGFYNDVMLPFLQNTLLMDNIGANEGIHYRKDQWNNNRLRIHAGCEGSEFKAVLWGGIPCTCEKTALSVDYPYSGHCQCCLPMQVKDPELDDISVALPGPLGEFAFYAFLENLIRNAVKHNREAFRNDPNLCLDVHIQIGELPEGDPDHDDFYKVEISENISSATPDLLKQLNSYVADPVVDRYGRLKKEALGIAEMKIMANLLGGSDDFSTMGSSLQVHGNGRLVYAFRMLKPKEIALISARFKFDEYQMKNGLRNFQTPAEFADQQKEGNSPAGYNFVIIDRHDGKPLKELLHLFPNRIFVHHAIKEHIPGAVEIDDQFIKTLKDASPDEILPFVWQHWFFAFHNAARKQYRLAVFFGQDDQCAPTCDWIKFAETWNTDAGRPGFSIIYQGEDHNEVYPAARVEDRLSVFDRHFDGYNALPDKSAIGFHQAFDKNSSDFVRIFSSRPSAEMIYGLAESALTKILVLDERVAEVAYEQIMQDEAPKSFYANNKRIEIGKWANIYMTTHLKINQSEIEPLHHRVQNDLPRVFVHAVTNRPDENSFDTFDVYWIAPGKDGNQEKHRIHPQLVILHQGVLENFFGKKLNFPSGDNYVNTLQSFIHSLRKFIPFIVVDSGRGIPPNLPPDVKFLPFSLVQDFLMQDRIAKFSLVKTLMGLIRRGEA